MLVCPGKKKRNIKKITIKQQQIKPNEKQTLIRQNNTPTTTTTIARKKLIILCNKKQKKEQACKLEFVTPRLCMIPYCLECAFPNNYNKICPHFMADTAVNDPINFLEVVARKRHFVMLAMFNRGLEKNVALVL